MYFSNDLQDWTSSKQHITPNPDSLTLTTNTLASISQYRWYCTKGSNTILFIATLHSSAMQHKEPNITTKHRRLWNSNFSIISILYIQSWTVYLLSSQVCMLMSAWVCFSLCCRKQTEKKTFEGVQKCAAFAILIPHLSLIWFYMFLAHKENILVSSVLIVSSRIMFCNLHFHMRRAMETFSGVIPVNLRCLSNNERKHTNTSIVINNLCTSSMFVLALTHIFLLFILIMYGLM